MTRFSHNLRHASRCDSESLSDRNARERVRRWQSRLTRALRPHPHDRSSFFCGGLFRRRASKSELVGVRAVLGSCDPLQVRRSVVRLHAVLVIDLVPRRGGRSVEGFTHQPMHQGSPCDTVRLECDRAVSALTHLSPEHEPFGASSSFRSASHVALIRNFKSIVDRLPTHGANPTFSDFTLQA